MSGNPDDGTLSGQFGNNEGDESVVKIYYDLDSLENFLGIILMKFRTMS